MTPQVITKIAVRIAIIYTVEYIPTPDIFSDESIVGDKVGDGVGAFVILLLMKLALAVISRMHASNLMAIIEPFILASIGVSNRVYVGLDGSNTSTSFE